MIEIIRAEEKYISQIAKLWRGLMMYHAEFDPYCELLDNAEEHYIKFTTDELKDENTLLLLAVYSGEAVGYMYGKIQDYPPVIKQFKQFYIEDMFIREDYRGHGIGKILLEKTSEWVRSKDIDRLQLDVHLKNPRGFNFWKECGFQEECYLMYKDI